ncbi:sulfotransferase family protein [Nocardioides cynanchi]|uniref:sulfotransferase family protein n=1 Tax=Nocardioides cynanchi TaxID=2558918 RepID=UPI00177EA5A5|nr:sulfotransferase [Nocardioides cynanchi]
MDEGPVFIVGSMRSGSTMLRLILDSHPRIAIGAETGFMGALLANRRIPGWKHGAEWFGRIGWSADELDARLREFYGGMFLRHAQSQGKVRWGDKTPFHTSHIPEMAEVFPDAAFVGIVRHPGAVAASLHRSFHYAFDEAVGYWCDVNRQMLVAAGELGDRFTMCRYEDLVSGSERVLRELMPAIGEEFDDALLRHHEVQRAQGAPKLTDGSTSSRDPIDARRAERWADEITPEQLLTLAEAVPIAAALGYTATGTGAFPAGAHEWTASGTELAGLFAGQPALLDGGGGTPLDLDADPAELARRLVQVEAALARTRGRRAVRLADAARRVQHGRTWADVKAASAMLRRDGRAR